ncbi:MAG: hypothetical protein LBM08_10040 [Dysgonamonadaceae bacterium]|jgi:hypothetical protein|nr:hypothetical protein [Dysgonamonadaceae bacterium]
MKKVFYRTISLLLLFVLFQGNGYAQMKDLISKSLRIGMTVPADFTVSVDTKEKFAVAGTGLSVVIQPYTSPAEQKQNNLASELIQHAESLGYKNLSNAETIELNGFQGCYATGKGGEKDKVLTILLMNIQTKQHLFVLIPYHPASEKTALHVANSFYAE